MRLADLRGRSVAVWGTGPHGRAAVRAAAANGPSRLLAVDDSASYLKIAWPDELAPLAGGDHAFPALVTADVVICSPEKNDHPWYAELHNRGIPVTTGDDLWLADHAAHTIAVTGSDETARLISRLLTALGRTNVLGTRPLLNLPLADEYVIMADVVAAKALVLAGRSSEAGEKSEVGEKGEAGEESEAGAAVGPDFGQAELIVVNGTDPALRDLLRGRTDANGFPPIPAGAGDSRFRVEDDAFFCSDDVLFPRATLTSVNGLSLCLALAVLDGLGIDVPGRRNELRTVVAAHT